MACTCQAVTTRSHHGNGNADRKHAICIATMHPAGSQQHTPHQPPPAHLLVVAFSGHQVQQEIGAAGGGIPGGVQRSAAARAPLRLAVPVPVGAVPQLQHLLRQACSREAGEGSRGRRRMSGYAKRAGFAQHLQQEYNRHSPVHWAPA